MGLLDRTFRDARMKTHRAATSEECNILLQEEKVDLAILDICLPDGDGLDLIHKIKSLYPSCPIIVMTGNPETENLLKSVESEVDGYMIKPVSMATLLFLVGQLFEGRHAPLTIPS